MRGMIKEIPQENEKRIVEDKHKKSMEPHDPNKHTST